MSNERSCVKSPRAMRSGRGAAPRGRRNRRSQQRSRSAVAPASTPPLSQIDRWFAEHYAASTGGQRPEWSVELMRDAIEHFRAELDGLIAAFRDPMRVGAAEAMASFELFADSAVSDLRRFGANTNALGSALRWGLAGADPAELSRLEMTRAPRRDEIWSVLLPRLREAGFDVGEDLENRRTVREHARKHGASTLSTQRTENGLLIASDPSICSLFTDALAKASSHEWMISRSIKRGLSRLLKCKPDPRVVIIQIPPGDTDDETLRQLVQIKQLLITSPPYLRHQRSSVIVISRRLTWLTSQLIQSLGFSAYVFTDSTQSIVEMALKYLGAPVRS